MPFKLIPVISDVISDVISVQYLTPYGCAINQQTIFSSYINELIIINNNIYKYLPLMHCTPVCAAMQN